MMKKLARLSALWIFIAVISISHIVFFASGEGMILIAVLTFLLAPILAVALAWGSYKVGRNVQKKCNWKMWWNIIFSAIVANVVSALYWIINDIFNSIKRGYFSVFYTMDYFLAPFRGDFPISGSEICYIEFVIVFIFMIMGFVVETHIIRKGS